MKTYCQNCKKLTDSTGPSKIITSDRIKLNTYCRNCGRKKSETCFYHTVKRLGSPPNY